jgi:hypothetical protein
MVRKSYVMKNVFVIMALAGTGMQLGLLGLAWLSGLVSGAEVNG